MSKRLAKRVLLIGWDAADWKHINPLLDAGLMPALERVINNGVMGNIATLNPILSPMLWNSIATGKTADKHGILGFVEPDPNTGDIRPVSSTSRKVKAIWNILAQQGFKSHVLGWFASHPAEPLNGIVVSDLFPLAADPAGTQRPVPNHAVHPPELAAVLGELRLHPTEVTAAELLPFVPGAARVDQNKDPRLAVIAKNLIETCSIHNVATWILQNQEWDFLAVYHTFIDHMCHTFMPFYPPKAEGLDEDLFQIYKDVVPAAYRFQDMLLDVLLQLAGEDTTVLILSDHGFHSDHLRPFSSAREAQNPALWHRPLGIFCMNGPHIRKDERVYGATLLDICPTILTLFGLPVGQDMDGRVLVNAFGQAPEIDHIPSWEEMPGECGMHPADARIDPAEAAALTQQFVALGYITAPDENKQKRVQHTIDLMRFNLAQVYVDTKRAPKAIPILEELGAANPPSIQQAALLAECYYLAGRNSEARAVLEKLIESQKETPRVDYFLGIIHLAENEIETGIGYLLKAEQAAPQAPGLHLRLGSAYLRLQRPDDAERAYRKALEADPDSPQAHVGLAIVHRCRKMYAESASEALTAVGIQHHLPEGHYALGVALAHLGQYDRAVLAFETAVSIMPGLRRGHRWLVTLHRRNGGDILKAAKHEVIARQITAGKLGARADQ